MILSLSRHERQVSLSGHEQERSRGDEIHSLLPIAYCLLPLAYCLLPLASCLLPDPKPNMNLHKSATILVIDDTPDNIRLLSAILTEHDYKVRKAISGQTALSTIEKSPPDLILLDIMMPDMNGYQVCQSLKKQNSTRDIPIIFISALDGIVDKVKAFEMGGVDYITKPFHDGEVLARIETHLTLRKQKIILQSQAQRMIQQNQKLRREIEERKRTEIALRLAQEKSDKLLLNILPSTVVDKLQNNVEGNFAERFEMATVLFADIVGFTPICQQISALELVGLLNQIFSKFDQLTEKHQVEKIKTIGDAYMVVGGIPVSQPNHAQAIAEIALEMQAEISQFQSILRDSLDMRIGIHSGSVVAGVIGRKKFIYDLWGDTVNVASRMESLGEAGKIQVTSETYLLLKDEYKFEKRGMIDVKGKGMMETYWLIGRA